jgi:dipeptidase
MAMYRQTYAGTEYDMTQNLYVKKPRSEEMIKSPIASPWMSWFLIQTINSIKPGTIEPTRPIAISACAYATILQCRDWLPDPIGGICWFAFENPGESPRIPIFAGVKQLPPSFEICAQHRFRMDSACWAFRRANRLAAARWGMAGSFVEKAIQEFEEKAFQDLPLIEKKALELYEQEKAGKGEGLVSQYLTQYTNDFARAAIQKYEELGDLFWAIFVGRYRPR